MDQKWIEYHCKSGQPLFLYNKITGEHKWAQQLGEVSTVACQIDFFVLFISFKFAHMIVNSFNHL